jgi:hypothetical protein
LSFNSPRINPFLLSKFSEPLRGRCEHNKSSGKLSLPDKRTRRSFEDRMMLTLEVPHGQELELPSSGPPTKQNSAQHLQMHPQHKQNLLITTPDVQNPMYNNKTL